MVGSDAPDPLAAADAAPRRTLAQWWLLLLLSVYYGTTYIDRLLISLLVPQIKATTGLSDTAMGLIMGPVPTVIFALASLPAGYLADRYPRRLVLAAGMALFAVATMALGFSRGFGTLAVARGVAAIGEAAVLPPAYSLIADTFARRRIGSAIAIFQVGGKLGNALALSAGGLLLLAGAHVIAATGWAFLAPWQMAFLLLCVALGLLAPLAYTLREPPRRGSAAAEAPRGQLWRYVVAERRLLLLMVAGFGPVGMVGFAMNAWVPTYLNRAFALGPTQYGPPLGVIALLSAAGLAIKGLALDWFYARGWTDIYIRFFIWLQFVTAPVLLAMFFVRDPWLFVAMFGLGQITTVPYVAYASTTLQAIAPGEVRARLMALGLIVFAIAGGLGAAAVGAISDHVFADEGKIGLSLAMLIAIAMPLSFLCLSLALRPLRAAIAAAERREG